MKEKAIESMRALLRREIDRENMPGGLFALYRDGQEVFSVVEGMADLENDIPLRRDSLFRVYSMTKPVTSVAAMMLVEEGKLRLTDHVSDYLPEFRHMNRLDPSGKLVPCERQITVWNLFTMTSGLVYPDPDPTGSYMQRCFDAFYDDNMAGRGPTTRKLAELVAGQPLAFEPGSGWRYGLSADVLGAIIEVVTGMRFGEFLQQRLFGPLGMADTGFYVPEGKTDRLTQLYKYEDGHLLVDEKRHLGLTLCLSAPSFESGGAGLISTIDDFARFGNMLANRGVWNGRRYLSEDTIRRSQGGLPENRLLPALDWDTMVGYDYGYLMRALRDNSKAGRGAIGEFGWDGWTGPYMSVDADNNVLMLFMMQVGGHREWSLIREMRDIALDALE